MATPYKTVKLKVKRSFYDKTDGLKLKKAGEELSVSPDRAVFRLPFRKNAGTKHLSVEKAAATKLFFHRQIYYGNSPPIRVTPFGKEG